jgi:hypothetical protein
MYITGTITTAKSETLNLTLETTQPSKRSRKQ